MSTAAAYAALTQQAADAAFVVGGRETHVFVNMMAQESGHFDPEIVECRRDSPAGARGIAQLMPVHWAAVNPCDPPAALRYAAGWLRSLAARYGNLRQAVAAYNWGPGNIDRVHNAVDWEAALPAETTAYLKIAFAGVEDTVTVTKPVLTWVPADPAGYSVGRAGTKPEAIVLHIMVGTLAGCDSWFANPAAGVSAHFGIGKDGTIHQYVSVNNTAYANGIVEPGATARLLTDNAGLPVNAWTCSIEHEGQPGDPVPDVQFDASTRLAAWLWQTVIVPAGASGLALDRDHIIGHYEISPQTRAHCPGWPPEFFARYIARVQQLLAVLPVPAPDFRAQLIAELRGIVAAADDDLKLANAAALSASVRRQNAAGKLKDLGTS